MTARISKVRVFIPLSLPESVLRDDPRTALIK